jgi:tight adherence protein B
LLRAARDCGGLAEAQATVLAAARFGGDVPDALATAARQPGAEGLRGLAACWRVAVDQGAGLAAGLDRLAAALRAERDQRFDLRAQLAGARATAVMLAGLPALGLLIGTGLGADPLHVLLHTGAGLGCLAAGGALEGLGLWWVQRIVRGAEKAA